MSGTWTEALLAKLTTNTLYNSAKDTVDLLEAEGILGSPLEAAQQTLRLASDLDVAAYERLNTALKARS